MQSFETLVYFFHILFQPKALLFFSALHFPLMVYMYKQKDFAFHRCLSSAPSKLAQGWNQNK